jgi:hypothetical protein
MISEWEGSKLTTRRGAAKRGEEKRARMENKNHPSLTLPLPRGGNKENI